MDNPTWGSERFGCDVRVTRHARERMVERGIPEALVKDLVETGTVKRKDARRLWIFKRYEGRDDNLVCAAAAKEGHLVIKTIMTHWREGEP